MKQISDIIQSPSFSYIVIRYITYLIQFINAFLLAKSLGSNQYGIYSFIFLIMQYMAYSNLGINESLNTEYAICKEEEKQKIWNTAWSLNIIINLILFVILFIIISRYNLFEKYNFESYSLLLLITCIITNLSRIYITYYKLYGRLFKLNVQQILPHLVLFCFIITLWSDLTVIHIIIVYLFTNLCSLILFLINPPKKPYFKIDKSYANILIRRGITLLLYNLSFYLLTLLSLSLVSHYFSVDEFGCYSFTNTLVNGIIMACGAFLFIFYPKILNRLHNCPENMIYDVINRIRNVYVLFIDIIAILSIFIAIGIAHFLPHYKNITVVFPILILGQIILNSTTGFSAYLLSKKKEYYLVSYGIISILFCFILGFLFANFYRTLHAMALIVPCSLFLYTYLTTRKSLLEMKRNHAFLDVMREIFTRKKWFTCILILFYAFILNHIYVIFLGIIIYFILNYRTIIKAISEGVRIISDKKSLII